MARLVGIDLQSLWITFLQSSIDLVLQAFFERLGVLVTHLFRSNRTDQERGMVLLDSEMKNMPERASECLITPWLEGLESECVWQSMAKEVLIALSRKISSNLGDGSEKEGKQSVDTKGITNQSS